MATGLLGTEAIPQNPLFNNKNLIKNIRVPGLGFVGAAPAAGLLTALYPSSGAGSEELAWEEQNMRRINSAQDVIDNHLNRDVNSSGAGYIFTPPEQEIVNTELPFIPPEYQTYDESFVTPDSGVVNQGFTPPDTQFQDEGFITPSSADMTTLYNKGLLGEEVIEDGLLSETAPPFYSKITKTIEDAQMNKASGDGWMGMINNSGVNQDELDWIGMKDFLADKKSVTKEEILDFARMNDLSTEVKEVILGGNNDANKEAIQGFPELSSIGINDDARLVVHNNEVLSNEYNIWYEQNADHQIIKSYNEDLVDEDAVIETFLKEALNFDVSLQNSLSTQHNNSNLITEGDYTDYKEMTFALPNIEGEYYLPPAHGYKDKNIFAHARFNTRDVDGKKTLFIEELQSDWVHLGLKEGFKKPLEERYQLSEQIKEVQQKRMDLINQGLDVGADGVSITQLADQAIKLKEKLETAKGGKIPDIPFKKNWQDIVLKRMIRYAAENGFDAIAMTGGNIQKDRYDLSKHIDSIQVNASDKAEGKIHVVAGNEIDLHIYPNQLEEHIGKDLAKKINNDIEEKNIFKNFNFIKQEFENFSQELSKKYDVPASQNIAMYENVASISKKDIDKYTKLQKAVYEDTNGLEYKGLDLQVGGEGLGEMYDKIFNKSLKKIGKKHNAEVELKELDDKYNMWFMNLTDSLKKQSIEAGMPIAFNKPVNPLFNYA